MKLRQFPAIVTHISDFTHIYEFLYVYRSLNAKKFANTKFRPGRNVLEFFCVPLYTNFLSDHHEKFQVASTYNANVKCQIWSFCCRLFLSYADNRHAHTHTHTQTNQLLKMWFFWNQRTSKHLKPLKSQFRKFQPIIIFPLPYIQVRESENCSLRGHNSNTGFSSIPMLT